MSQLRIPSPSWRHRAGVLLLVFAPWIVVAIQVPSSQGADGTWNVDADGNWGKASNWAGGVVANGAGYTAYFTNDITATRTVTLNSSRTIGHLVFSDNGAAGSEWRLSGSNVLTLDVTTGTPTITVITPTWINVVLAGNDGLTIGGGSRLRLRGANTYTGNTLVQAGTTLELHESGSSLDNRLPIGTVLTIENTATLDLLNSSQELRGLTGGGTVKTTLGPGNGGGGPPETVTLAPQAGDRHVFTGTFTNEGDDIQVVLKSGSTGTQVFSGASTFGGGTTINGGTLLVNNTSGSGTGTGSVTVNSGGTLGGTGTISGSVTGAGGSTINPGDPTANNGIGTLTLGATTLNSTSVLAIDIDGSKSDLLKVNGNLTISSGARLDLRNVSNPPDGSVFQIVTYTGTLSGVLSNYNGTVTLSDGAQFTDPSFPGYYWEIQYGDYLSYTNSIVVIARVSEPAVLLLLATVACGMGLVFVGRRRE